MAWSQLGYKLYCFKQWYSPLTTACITQFQWLWVKYILIKMCKKWYPTEGEGLADFQNFSKSITSTAKISKFKSLHLKIPQSKSPHFFHVSHFLNPNSPHSPYFLCIISMFSPRFLRIFSTLHFLCICYAEIHKKWLRKCGTSQRMRRSEVRELGLTLVHDVKKTPHCRYALENPESLKL